MQKLLALLLLACVSSVASVASATIVITDAYTLAVTYNGSVTDHSALYDAGGGSASIDTLPGYSSTTSASYTSSSLSNAFDHVRGGDVYGYSYAYSLVVFTSDVDIPYTAAGTYSSSLGGHLYSSLLDSTTNSYLYYSNKDSYYTEAALTLGGADGDSNNYFQGSLTGTLLAAHQYQWIANCYTQDYPLKDLGAIASGRVTLTLGVPEISGVVMAELASVAGVVGFRRRRGP